MSDPPLFEGEPERCALCGERGHTHDTHWLYTQALEAGWYIATPEEQAVLMACAKLQQTTLLFYQASTPFRHVAKAELARRLQQEKEGHTDEPKEPSTP